MKKFVVFLSMLLLISCTNQGVEPSFEVGDAREVEEDKAEATSLEEDYEAVNGSQEVQIDYGSPFIDTPILVNLLHGPQGGYIFGVFSDVEGGCQSVPSAETCSYAVWHSETGEIMYKKLTSSWEEWRDWGGPVEWSNVYNAIYSFSTFGDSGRYERLFTLYNFETEKTTVMWKLYAIGYQGDHRLLGLDWAEHYFLDDTQEGVFTIYHMNTDAFESNDSIGSTKILYDKLEKITEVKGLGELKVYDDHNGLIFSLGSQKYEFDPSTNLITEYD